MAVQSILFYFCPSFILSLLNRWALEVMAAFLTLALALTSFSLLGAAQFPIPRRYDGFSYARTPAASDDFVLVEAFFDPLCPDSKAVWPSLKQVLVEYGKDLKFIMHPFALPYHHNSFFSARALHIADQLNSSFTYPLLDLLFEHQDEFSNMYTAKETPKSVIRRLAKLFSSHFGEAYLNEFEEGFNKSATDQATRISFKYACSRAITGTPIFLVNGVLLNGVDESWGPSQWSKVLRPLLESVPTAASSR